MPRTTSNRRAGWMIAVLAAVIVAIGAGAVMIGATPDTTATVPAAGRLSHSL